MRPTTTIDVHRADDRYHTDLGWLDSRHSFSFGQHHDPANTAHGLLIVSNDDRVAPGGGFGTHGHRDMEIVTWVLDGRLEHRDSEGNHGELYPGLVQRMSAGTGIRHSEMNASSTDPVHFVQMWVVPSEVGVAPGYRQLDVNDALADGGLVPVASGRADHVVAGTAIDIHQPAATMWVARPKPGRELTLPTGRYQHLFVARGRVELNDRSLFAGDAARLVDAGSLPLRSADEDDGSQTEIIVWEFDDRIDR